MSRQAEATDIEKERFDRRLETVTKNAFSKAPANIQNPKEDPSTWRIIPFSKWLITMVSKSPKWGCSIYKWPKWI